jgi:ankyrin repeat protein
MSAVDELLDADPSRRDAHAPNHRQSGGYTALHEVVAIGNADVVRLLLESGAEPDARNGEGQTPAELARKSGHAAIAETLDAAARGRHRS